MSVVKPVWFGFPRTRPLIRMMHYTAFHWADSIRRPLRKMRIYGLYVPMAYNVDLKWELFTITQYRTWDQAYEAAQFLAELRVHENAMPCIVYPDQFHPAGLMCDCERP